MMNAEATAEKRPAYHAMNKNAFAGTTYGTHKDQSVVQVPVTFLEEFPVELLSHPMIFTVEFSSVVFLDGRRVLCPSVE
jgi:hypothetical protein